jgi:hypothetical protein
MSRFMTDPVTCPYCGDMRDRSVARSINAERSPHLRQAILSGDFQRVDCPACGQRFCVDAPFAYIDGPRREWVVVFGENDVEGFRALEPVAESTFELGAGPRAPKVAREIFGGVKRRAVFGGLALTEKLLAWDAGLDDGALEVLKFSAFGAFAKVTRGAPVGRRHHIRLVEVTDEDLVFLSGGEDLDIEILAVDRRAYGPVAERCAAGDPLFELLTEGPFVDMGRVTVPGDLQVTLPMDGRSLF